jgi:hypothetical protein
VAINRPSPHQILVTGQIATGFILTEDGYVATGGPHLGAAMQNQQLAVIIPPMQVIPCRLVTSSIQWQMGEQSRMTAELGVLKTSSPHAPLPWVGIGEPIVVRQGDEVGVVGYQPLEDPRHFHMALEPSAAQEFLRNLQAQTFAMRATVASRFEISYGDRQSSFLYLDRHLPPAMAGAPVLWLESGEVIGVVSGSRLDSQMSGIAQLILPAELTKVYGVQLLQECVANLRAKEAKP